MRYTITHPQYLKYVEFTPIEFSDVSYSGKCILEIDWDFMYGLAKATGLRSNKTRHIKKRFKLVLIQAIKDHVRDDETD